MNRRAGFTLLEVVISAALGAMILAAAALCLSASVASQKLIEPRVDLLQSARVALALMTADLRAACPLDDKFAFLGTRRSLGQMRADNLDFATHHYAPRRPREGDFCEVSYYVDKDAATGQFGLWRRRNPLLAFDPLSGGSREEIARGLRGLKLEYTDGLDWYDSWGEINDRKRAASMIEHANLQGLPQAVRVTLLFDSETKPARADEANAAPTAPPLVFSTVVFLEMAAAEAAQTNAAPTPAQTPTNSAPAPNGPSS